MCRFKFRLLIALLTFGIGVLVVSFWLVKSNSPQVSLKEAEQTEPEIVGFREVVSAKDENYVTVQGWIDIKFLCRDENDLQNSICTTALVGKSPAEESMYIQLWICNEQIKSSCIDWNPSSPYLSNVKVYDYNSNSIDFSHQIKVTAKVSVVDDKKGFAHPIGRIESIDDSKNAIIPLSEIDLRLIGHTAPKGRVQDLDYNQLTVIEQLINHNKESIPFLISKLTDETKTKGPVIDFWNDVRVGDVAFIILTDFFTGNSWEQSTIDGTGFGAFLGCNNPDISSDSCFYHYVEKHGRKNIKTRWQKIWKENKDRIYWDDAERCFRVKA
jgi:hypothetical protein